MGKGDVDELWFFKVVLRSFEMVSKLRFNFFKINLYGIYVEDDFLRMTFAFLACKIEQVSFNSLGIYVGENPRRCIT